MDTGRLAKFLLLLDSDKAGEVCAAAQALGRTLKSAATMFMISLALSMVASSIATRSSRTKVVYPDIEELSTREIAQLCLDQHASRLKDRERPFLEDMTRRYSAPTPRQEA